ncbi:MAG TPA: regulatory protein RecX [Cyclobacteriaceae bacterium]|nr:RecX family transcriptional regulator [Cyclobacteriaceae bacterium]MCB9237712.1 RecX family transcriptional regulator [Flammeovirgaceae bacterium]MCB0498774.1 RecX family transcriptional regulator [Cyclobacteriaceae bacterium]MCO5270186.1 RecX family transcriptional regulator [Cyclobacteriaceae bacterium]MCW5903765.1 RecX family transcriptional regulator [Cyclobacteriaceae bacterium]
MEKRHQKLTPQQALQKIYRYCAYQERSHKEVRNKLYSYGLWTSEVEDLLARLITEDFLNEERFAKSFAGGKFRMKKWGRRKIEKELENHGLSHRCTRIGLQEIDGQEYHRVLTALIQKKWAATDEGNPFKKKDKVARYAIMKGFEPDLVWGILKEMPS